MKANHGLAESSKFLRLDQFLWGYPLPKAQDDDGAGALPQNIDNLNSGPTPDITTSSKANVFPSSDYWLTAGKDAKEYVSSDSVASTTTCVRGGVGERVNDE
ncbi:unnamed protein product [Cuscuta campestris]|uniref:Uncharacterized protein n=1 Tax=Cuscuta campestris TaxID=132261 RepID=A0A484MZU5_9ASTE|nr:unnamed protein product [Cuscuta campestris]